MEGASRGVIHRAKGLLKPSDAIRIDRTSGILARAERKGGVL